MLTDDHKEEYFNLYAYQDWAEKFSELHGLQMSTKAWIWEISIGTVVFDKTMERWSLAIGFGLFKEEE